MTGAIPDEKHRRFQADLRASDDARWLVAMHYVKQGYEIKSFAPTRIAPTRDQARAYSDNGDLYVAREGVTHRIEAKGLNYNFTSRADWPHGKNFIVCSVSKWERADPKPYEIAQVNAARTHVAIVKGESRPRWTVKRVRDRRYDEEENDYFAPLDDVRFEEL